MLLLYANSDHGIIARRPADVDSQTLVLGSKYGHTDQPHMALSFAETADTPSLGRMQRLQSGSVGHNLK